MASLKPGNFGAEWRARAIGERFLIGDDMGPPPASVAGMRFIKLTAGLDGAGQYNDGALIHETLTGTAPLVEATAEIAIGPRAGTVVHLWNTEGRYPKPGVTSGAVANDRMQQITGQVRNSSIRTGNSNSDASGAFSRIAWGSDGALYEDFSGLIYTFDSAGSPNARTDDHTDVKHEQLTAYMRVT